MANEPVYVTFEFRGNLEEEVSKVTLGIKGLRDESAKTYQRLIADSSSAFNSLSTENRKLAVSVQENINALRNLVILQKALDEERESGTITIQQHTQSTAALAIQETTLKNAITTGLLTLNARIQMEGKAIDSVTALSQKVRELTETYYNMSKADRDGAAGQGILTQIGDLDKQIGQAQARLSQYNRSAGTRFNGLSMSVQQVARELPSLTMGINMFFLAISNNLPILSDNLKAARLEYAALKAEGQAATPVWKQVLSSIVSWQTALVVGITLLTVYGKDVVDWTKKMLNADDSQKKLNKSIEDFNVSLQKEKRNLQSVFSVLLKSNEGTEGRRKAINEVNNLYGRYLPNLLSEKSSLDEINKAYRKITSAILENTAAKAQAQAIEKATEKNIENQANLIESLGEKIKKGFNIKTDEELNTLMSSVRKSIESALGNGDNSIQAALKGMSILDEKHPTGYVYDRKGLYDEMKTYANKIYEYYREINQIQKKFNPFFSKEDAEKAMIKNKEYYESMKQQAESVLDSLTPKQIELLNANKTRGIDSSIVEKYKAAKAAIKEATEALKIYDYSDKKANEAAQSTNRINSLLSKEESERVKLEKDLQFRVEQAKVDTMDESWKKTKAQMELNHRKELEELEMQQNEYLRKVVEYEQKKFEADPKNKGKVFDASTVQLSDTEVALFDKLDKELQNKQIEDRKRFTIDIKRQQSDISNHFASELNKQLNEIDRHYEDALKKAEGYQDQIEQLNNSWKKDRNDAVNESFINESLQSLEIETEATMKMFELKRNFYVTESVYQLKRNDQEKKFAKQRLDILKKSTAQEGTERYRQIENEKKQLSDYLDYLDEYGNKLKGEIIQDALSGLSDIAGAIGGLNDDLGETMANLQQVIDAVAKLSTGNYIGAAVSVITSVVSSIAQSNQEAIKYAKETEGYYWDAVNYKIEHQIKLMKELQGISAGEVGETIQKQIDELMDILHGTDIDVKLNKNGGIEAFEKLIEKAIGQAKENGNEFAVDFLEGIWNSKPDMTGNFQMSFFDVLKDLSQEQILSLQSMPEIWQVLPEEIQKYIKQLQEAVDKQKELEESTKETLTSTNVDSIADSIIQGFAEGKRSAADFADSFQEMLNNAVLQGIKIKALEEPLRQWYEKFAEYSGSGLTEDKIAELKAQYDKIIADAAKQLEDMEKVTGLPAIGAEAGRQAAAKGIASMSQDSANELNGNFNAMLIYLDKTSTGVTNINTLLVQGLDTLNRIAANTDRLENIEKYMKAMSGHMQNVSNNGLILRKQ